jgi:CAAX prenyl protease-like protein
MKKIIKYLADYLKEDFNLIFYLITALFLAGMFYWNYSHDLKRDFIDPYYRTNELYLRYFLFVALPYYFILFIESLTKKDFSPFKNIRFHLYLLFAFLVLAVGSSTKHLNWDLSHALVSSKYLIDWVAYCVSNFHRIFFLLLIPFIFKLIIDKEDKTFYGFTLKNFDWKPYFYMLLIMLPLIFWASFKPSFLRMYPIYKPGTAESMDYISYWISIPVFEFFYALRFIAVESFFRGFLVIGLARLVGTRAIMPMVVTYALWHFGKPGAETLGSIFGGFILGIIAYRSKTVFGGVLIHMGVALLMEAAAYAQHYLIK